LEWLIKEKPSISVKAVLFDFGDIAAMAEFFFGERG